MTQEERDEKIEAIKQDRNTPLPIRAKQIERVMAEFQSIRNLDRETQPAVERAVATKGIYEKQI